jgi:hypothetical protein
VAGDQPQSQTLGASRRNGHVGERVPCTYVAAQVAPVLLSGFAKWRRHCGMLTFTDDEFKAEIEADTGLRPDGPQNPSATQQQM